MERKRLRVLVSGRVQGVFFRASTREQAERLNLGGWVKNRPDGTVEALFEGDESALANMLNWCHQGPPGSRPQGVEATWQDCREEFNDFRIVYF